MWMDKDGWIHPEDKCEPATLAENNPDDVDWGATRKLRKEQEAKEMGGKNKDDGEKVACGTQQVYISIEGACLPTIAIRPVDTESYPANLVKLEGVVVELPGGRGEEKSAWDIAQRISDLCRIGSEAESEMGNRNAMCDHLAYAYNILTDYVNFDDEHTVSKETAETLIRGAMDRIVRAGKCFGFELD